MSSPSRAPSQVEVFIGRSLAACVHPVAAWRHRSRSIRLSVVVGYLVSGYVAVLLALLLLGSSPTF